MTLEVFVNQLRKIGFGSNKLPGWRMDDIIKVTIVITCYNEM